MPKILRTIPETDESVTRPVIVDITRQLFAFTGIPDTTQILYPGPLNTTYQLNSTITKSRDSASFNETQRLTVEVEEEDDPDYILTGGGFVGEQLRIFLEDTLGIHIKPMYSTTLVTINFRYRAMDRPGAERWRREIAARIKTNREAKLLKASYHYIIPESFLEILKEIHRVRENVEGYGDTYNDWFTQHLTQRASIATNMAGGYETWVVAETQQEIQGYFDFEGPPEKGDRNGEGETWEINFSYKFHYEKPMACLMYYPVMIHNQLLSTRFRSQAPVYKPSDTARSYGNSRKHFARFEKHAMLDKCCQQPGISIPAWDEFIPASIPPATKRAFTAMMVLDKDGDHTKLFSLDHLGTKTLKPHILEFLKKESEYINKPNQSAYTLTLYAGINPLPDSYLKLAPDLSVRATVPLDLRIAYHVRLGFLTDLKSLSGAAKDRLRENAAATIELLKSIDCTLERKGLLPVPIPGTDYLPGDDLEDAIEIIDRGKDGESVAKSQSIGFNTVQTFFIEAHRAEK